MSARSPGPWIWRRKENGDDAMLDANEREVFDGDWSVGQADSRLIAAAPELLEALKEACKTLPLANWHDLIARIEGGK